MNTISYQALIDSKTRFDATLRRLDIKPKRNRWVVAYELVSELELARLQGEVDNIDNALLGKMRFALTDLHNMLLILEQFNNDKSDLFKKKYIEMLRGSDDQTAEINTRPRDAQLELMMCAIFKKAGLDAQLHNPHPDIIVSANGRTYGFECKRVSSSSGDAVQKHIEKAISQLNDYFLDDDFSKRGMPLICIDRHITGGDKILDAYDEESSRKRLGYEIEQFIYKHRRHWVGLDKVHQERIIGVMIQMNVTTILRTEDIQVVSSQTGANNGGWTVWGRQMFQDFTTDIAQYLGPVEHSEL